MATIRLMEVIKEPAANQYLPFPYEIGEKIEYRGECNEKGKKRSFTRQFIKIFRFKYKREESINRDNFKKLGKWEFDEGSK
jgi:hypothetical protein